MDFIFSTYEAVWLLALLFQPLVLIYYVCNDRARKFDVEVKAERGSHGSRVIHSIAQIFSLSISSFTIVVFSKILLMTIFGLEALIFMLGGLLLMTLVTIAYLASFFAAPNAKQFIFFAAFVVGAIITYAVIIPSGFTLERLYDGEFYEFIIPFMFPGLIGFIALAIFALALIIIRKVGRAKESIQKLSQPLWDKRRVIKKTFGFYFHLVIWIFLVLETVLNQTGYSIFSWV